MRQSKAILDRRTVSPDYKPQISPVALAEVRAEFENYCSVVRQSNLTPDSQGRYIDFGEYFVRWLCGTFVPGAKKAPYRLK